MSSGDKEVIDVLHNILVKISFNNSTGTGFWIAPGLILTCAHVVSGAYSERKSVEVIWRSTSYSAKVINYFDEEDIALIECEKKTSVNHVTAILSEDYLIDDNLYSFGFSEQYPNGESLTCVIEGISNSPHLIKLKKGQVVPGFSGAPLLNRRTGAICGVLRRTRDKTTDLGGRAIPIKTITAAFPIVAETQIEIRKTNTRWSDVLSSHQKMRLGIKFYAASTRDRVAEIYSLLNYDVDRNTVVSNQSVDLKIERRLADIVIQRVVFIYEDGSGSDSIDLYAAKLFAIKKEYDDISGTIVSSNIVDQNLIIKAKSHGLQFITLSSLESQLFDPTGYINKLIREIETDPRYSLDLFIEPFIGKTQTSKSQKVIGFLTDWLDDSENKQLTILGDVGIGKTFLSKFIAYSAALKFRENPASSRLPILIDLRNADRQFTIEGLFLSYFAKNEMGDVSFDLFLHSIRSGQVLVILDGFDEMSAKVTPQTTAQNFQELTRIVEGKAKVILTCRTHYFRSRSDEEEVVYGESGNYSSESARELYWDLISRRGFQIAYLREFTFPQIKLYIEKVKGEKASAALEKIKSIYNLEELCQRPMLLEMIVKSIGKIDTKNISAATLYQVFTDAWIHRDKWRDVLTPNEKCDFLEGLACLLTSLDEEKINFNLLGDYVKGSVGAKISDPKRLLEIDNDVRTSTFLTRDDGGCYGFAHKSYREYFYSRSVKSSITKGQYELISKRRLTPEEVGFLVDNLNQSPKLLSGLVKELKLNLVSSYVRFVSENSLLVLIAINKGPIWERSEESQVVLLPDNMQLQGALLNQLDLYGLSANSADFSGADLSESSLSHSVFNNARAVGTKFNLSELIYSNWDYSELVDSNFKSANLDKSSFRQTHLNGCEFKDSSLVDVDVSGADLTGASVNETKLGKILVPITNERTPLLPFLTQRGDMRTYVGGIFEDPAFYETIRLEVESLYRGFLTPLDSLDDVMQEALFMLFRQQYDKKFENEDQLIKFVTGLARRVLIRKSRLYEREEETELSNEVVEKYYGYVDDQQYSLDVEGTIDRAMKLLSDSEGQVLSYMLDGHSLNEIANLMGISPASVSMRRTRLRLKIKQKLGHEFEL